MDNNYSWLGKLEVINFLREIGKHFSVGSMLSKEAVRSRLSAGISYTEFSYMILQSYDFLKLNELYNCELQAGGSDQWGEYHYRNRSDPQGCQPQSLWLKPFP